MPYKWDEKTTLVFLHAYQKHPCLWNPYDVKYYNCLAKNDALKNIIKELNISKLNISDCLEQIKVIRAKYGEEQIRIIKGLQSQKPTTSPFAWFPIIAGMLVKVINDEEKLQNGMKSRKTISRSIFKNHVTISHDKDIRTPTFPCAHGEMKEYNFKTKHTQDFKTTRKNTKFKKAGYMLGGPDKLDEKGKEKYDGRLDLLLCPSCGWEDTKPDKLNIAARKAYELIQSDTIPCPEYTNVMGKLHEEFSPHWQQIVNDRAKYNTVPCPSFLRSLPICISHSANMPICHTYCPQDTGNCISNQQMRQAIVASKPKPCTRGTQLFSEQSFLERRTRQVGTGIERCNKKIQNRICVSRTNVALPIFKCAIIQTSNRAETDTIRRCHKEYRSKPWIPQKELKQAAINTVEQCDKEIQSTICVSPVNLSDYHASEERSSTIRKSKQSASAVRCPSKGVQDVIGINLNTAECFMPNCVLITTNGNYVPLAQTNIKLKRLGIDKCPKENLCQHQKETKKDPLALSGEEFVENEVCLKENCPHDTTEFVKHNLAIVRVLLQCLEKIIHPQEEAKTRSVTSLSSKKVDVKSNSSKESETCEITKFVSATELRSASCLPCLEEKEKNNATAAYIKTLLEVIRHVLALDNKKCIVNAQECVREEDSTKAFTILSELKKCADKISKMYMATDCLKKHLSNEFRPRYKSKYECLTKINVASSSTGVLKNGTDQSTGSYMSLKNVEVLYKLAIPETKDHDLLGNYAASVETATEKQPSAESREIATHAEIRRDVCLNVSLSRVSLCDAETQYIPKQLRDTGVVSEHEKSFEQDISVGTQKREPISVRVMKCSNSERILKCDKETCVHDTRVTWPRGTINDCRGRQSALQHLSENAYRKYIVRKHYNEASIPVSAVSYAREKEVNLIDYHISSLSNKNYKCDENYRDALSYNRNWRRINNSTFGLLSSRRISRIPLYARSYKYIQRTNPHRISRSYM